MLNFWNQYFHDVRAEFKDDASLSPRGKNTEWNLLYKDVLDAVRLAGWNVEGIEVDVRAEYELDGPALSITSIHGNLPGLAPFRINVGYDGIYDVSVDGLQASRHSDGSGSANLYVGKNWEADGKAWTRSVPIHEKLDRKPRKTLHYDLRRRSYLVSNDIGRMYDAKSGDPESMTFREIAEKQSELLNPVLEYLRSLPQVVESIEDANELLVEAFEQEPVPATEDFPVLYTRLERGQAHDILSYQFGEEESREDLHKAQLHQGKRLFSLGTPGVNSLAHDGFVYAYEAPNQKTHKSYDYSSSLDFAARLKLENLNDVYVVDDNVYREAQVRVSEVAEKRGMKELSNDMVAEMCGALVKTMVPASEYKGDYTTPVFCINRPIGPSEIEVLVAPVRVIETDNETFVAELQCEPPVTICEEFGAFGKRHAERLKGNIEATFGYLADEHPALLGHIRKQREATEPSGTAVSR